MNEYTIAVKLKAPDPAAVTVLNALSGMGVQLPPARLERYDIWRFELESGGEDAVREIVGHFTDIVNPNKHLWTFVSPGEAVPGQGCDLHWTGLLVKDREDAVGSDWAEILKRRGFPVLSVRRGTLWSLGYLDEIDESLASRLAMDLAVSGSRTGGLLSNPIFQEVLPWT